MTNAEKTEPQQRWKAWIDAYLALLADPAGAKPICPSHRDGTVHLAYTGDPVTRIGYGIIWCDTCHEGIATGRSRVTPDIPILPLGMAPEERAKTIPADVVLLPPDPCTEEGEETTF